MTESCAWLEEARGPAHAAEVGIDETNGHPQSSGGRSCKRRSCFCGIAFAALACSALLSGVLVMARWNDSQKLTPESTPSPIPMPAPTPQPDPEPSPAPSPRPEPPPSPTPSPSPSKDFSPEKASMYAHIAGAAYCPSEVLENWGCGPYCMPGISDVKVCPGATTQAFVARMQQGCVVSFQGTKTTWAMIEDMAAWHEPTPWKCENCEVHDGFLREWVSLDTCIKASLNSTGCSKTSEIHVTGHSLGAAVSSLAMMDLADEGWTIAEAYNFGMPRLGNVAFAEAFESYNFSSFYRITHRLDPVVHVPPRMIGYMHLAPEVFYPGDLSDGFIECPKAEGLNCSGQFWNLLRDAFYISDHLNYMGILTGTIGCAQYLEMVRAAAAMEKSPVLV